MQVTKEYLKISRQEQRKTPLPKKAKESRRNTLPVNCLFQHGNFCFLRRSSSPCFQKDQGGWSAVTEIYNSLIPLGDKGENLESQAQDLFLHPTDTLGLSLAILASITSIQRVGLRFVRVIHSNVRANYFFCVFISTIFLSRL